MMKLYIVKYQWKRSYERPVCVEKGEEVFIDSSIIDKEFSSWVWGITAKGNEGWIPNQFLKIMFPITKTTSKALVLDDYSANELTVEKGDIVCAENELDDWVWCFKPDEPQIKGWLPLKNLEYDRSI